jgi:hypothetical protein
MFFGVSRRVGRSGRWHIGIGTGVSLGWLLMYLLVGGLVLYSLLERSMQ